MAVGRTAAVLSLGAISDAEANPTWSGLRKGLIAAAKQLAADLHRRGCPTDHRQCI